MSRPVSRSTEDQISCRAFSCGMLDGLRMEFLVDERGRHPGTQRFPLEFIIASIVARHHRRWINPLLVDNFFFIKGCLLTVE